jgi:hypothetical protein
LLNYVAADHARESRPRRQQRGIDFFVAELFVYPQFQYCPLFRRQFPDQQSKVFPLLLLLEFGVRRGIGLPDRYPQTAGCST